MDAETQQFLQERAERIRLLHERQERELEQFDEESARLGFRFVGLWKIIINVIYFYIIGRLDELSEGIWVYLNACKWKKAKRTYKNVILRKTPHLKVAVLLGFLFSSRLMPIDFEEKYFYLLRNFSLLLLSE